jgi:hypothetical protein
MGGNKQDNVQELLLSGDCRRFYREERKKKMTDFSKNSNEQMLESY